LDSVKRICAHLSIIYVTYNVKLCVHDEIGPRSRTERESANHIDRIGRIVQTRLVNLISGLRLNSHADTGALKPVKPVRLEIEIEIKLEFNQSEERKLVSGLVNFALISQNPIQSQSQSLV